MDQIWCDYNKKTCDLCLLISFLFLKGFLCHSENLDQQIANIKTSFGSLKYLCSFWKIGGSFFFCYIKVIKAINSKQFC